MHEKLYILISIIFASVIIISSIFFTQEKKYIQTNYKKDPKAIPQKELIARNKVRNTSAQQIHDFESSTPLFDIFSVKNSTIFYKVGSSAGIVPNVDIASFQPLTRSQNPHNISGYAQDDSHIFYVSSTLPNIEQKSFRVLSTLFSKDNNKVYFVYNNKITHMDGADSKTFKMLTNHYSKDKSGLWYVFGNKFGTLKNSTASYLQKLKGDYVHDLYCIYYRGVPTSEIHDGSIFFDNKPGRRDYTCTHANNTEIQHNDIKQFNEHYLTNGKKVFYNGIVLKDANPKTFSLLSEQSAWDEKRIYIHNKLAGILDKIPANKKKLPYNLKLINNDVGDLWYKLLQNTVIFNNKNNTAYTKKAGNIKEVLQNKIDGNIQSFVTSHTGNLYAVIFSTKGVDSSSRYSYTTNSLKLINTKTQQLKTYTIVKPGNIYVDNVSIAPNEKHFSYTINNGSEIRIVSFPELKTVSTLTPNATNSQMFFGATTWINNDEYLYMENNRLIRTSLDSPNTRHVIDNVKMWQRYFECKEHTTKLETSPTNKYVYYISNGMIKIYDTKEESTSTVPTLFDKTIHNKDTMDIPCRSYASEMVWVDDVLFYNEHQGPSSIENYSACIVSWNVIKSYNPTTQSVSLYTDYSIHAP